MATDETMGRGEVIEALSPPSVKGNAAAERDDVGEACGLFCHRCAT